MERATTTSGETRRAAIIEAALEPFLNQGVSGTTLKEIQRSSGSSNGSLYHFFSTKEALAGAVYAYCSTLHQQAFLDELARHEDAEAAVKGIVRMHLAWCVENPGMARFLATTSDPAILEASERELKDGNERFSAAVRDWWRPHVHYGALRPLTAAQSLSLWLGPAQEWIRAWLLGAYSAPPTEAETEMLADAAWLCLRADSDAYDG
jgi:AcrR family transcriptional regulator